MDIVVHYKTNALWKKIFNFTIFIGKMDFRFKLYKKKKEIPFYNVSNF